MMKAISNPNDRRFFLYISESKGYYPNSLMDLTPPQKQICQQEVALDEISTEREPFHLEMIKILLNEEISKKQLAITIGSTVSQINKILRSEVTSIRPEMFHRVLRFYCYTMENKNKLKNT